jgi:hypothetical protein
MQTADTLPDIAASPSSEEPAGPVPSTPAPATGGEAVSPPWNGEWEGIVKEPWWSKVPEDVRPHVEAGIKTKYTNFHRGADQVRAEAKAAAATAAERAARLEADLEAAKAKGDYWSKLLDADDAVKPLADKVASLEAALGEKTKALAEYEQQLAHVSTQRVFDTHKAKYADIYDDFQDDPNWTPDSGRQPEPTGAYVEFLKLIQAGIAEERAAKMVRATMEPAAAPAAVAEPAPVVVERARPVVPPGIAAASTGAGPSAARSARDTDEPYDVVMARKRREAEMEEG